MHPDNFFQFVALFTVAISSAAYLFFSFYRSWIILCNVLMFLLCAYRLASEYFIHQIETYDVALIANTTHSLVSAVVTAMIWFCTYAYIRPFRQWRYEIPLNWLLLALFIPFMFIHYYGIYHQMVYLYLPEKIDGYWKFTPNFGSIWLKQSNLLALVYSFSISLIFLIEIIQTRRRIFFKSILLVSFLVIPVIFFYFNNSTLNGSSEKIPSSGALFLLHVVIISWFCSDYRLFQSTFGNITKDILNSIADLAIYTDYNLNIQFINQPLKKLFNIKNFTGSILNFFAKYSHYDQSYIQGLIQQLRDKQELQENLQFRVGDEELFYHLKAKPFLSGSIQVGYIFILNNQTEIRRNQALLKQSNQTKDQLFAIIGHDLRKPGLAFRSIGKKVNYLLQRGEYKTLQELGDHWEISANSLNHLLNNLLNWAMQQRGALPYRPENVQLTAALESSMETLHAIFLQQYLKLESIIDPDLIVRADYNALTTILRNVLDNASKFTLPQGCITIRAQREEGQVCIYIQDNGIGMNATELEQLFTVKKAVQRQDANGKQGAGIGLNLVRELVLLNQGRIEVSSNVGVGTTVLITLPQGVRAD